jgi:Phage integrase family
VGPGELRKAEWKDIDLNKAEWRYVASKTHPNHIVPLSKQAMRILRELHPLTGTGKYLFPGARSAKRPMSDNAVLAAMRRMEIPADVMTGHGFRASFRTISDEVLKFRVDCGAQHGGIQPPPQSGPLTRHPLRHSRSRPEDRTNAPQDDRSVMAITLCFGAPRKRLKPQCGLTKSTFPQVGESAMTIKSLKT